MELRAFPCSLSGSGSTVVWVGTLEEVQPIAAMVSVRARSSERSMDGIGC